MKEIPIGADRILWTVISVVVCVILFYLVLHPVTIESFMKWLENAR